MKIIARHQATAGHMIPGGIVELTANEMELLSGLKYDEGKCIYPGVNIEISKRYKHAVRILEAAENAKKVSGQLRALADTVELSFPAIDAITETPEGGGIEL